MSCLSNVIDTGTCEGGGGGLTPPVALSDLANIADGTILGNDNGAPAPPEELAAAAARAVIGAPGIPVTLAQIAAIADQRILGNVSGAPAVPTELTAAQVASFVNALITGKISGLTANRIAVAAGATSLQDFANFNFISSQLRLLNGSQANPALVADGDLDTGFYWGPTGANSMGVSCGGVLQLIWDTFAMFVNSARLRPLVNDTTLCGADDTRWTEFNARHKMTNTRTVTVDTTFDRTYQTVFLNSAVTPRTGTLPSAVTARVACGNSSSFRLRNIGVQTWTIAATAGNVNGAATDALATGEFAKYESDGAEWWRVG